MSSPNGLIPNGLDTNNISALQQLVNNNNNNGGGESGNVVNISNLGLPMMVPGQNFPAGINPMMAGFNPMVVSPDQLMKSLSPQQLEHVQQLQAQFKALQAKQQEQNEGEDKVGAEQPSQLSQFPQLAQFPQLSLLSQFPQLSQIQQLPMLPGGGFAPPPFNSMPARSANINYKGRTIFEACKTGDLPLLYMLRDQGANPNVFDAQGATPLHWACQNGHAEIVKFLLDTCRVSADTRTTDGESQTPLMWACIGGRVNCAKELLDHGSPINAQDARGYTAAFHATHYGHTLLVHFLFTSGADLTILDTDGHNVVHWAAYKNELPLIKYYIETRAMPVDTLDIYNRNALLWAARQGHVDMAKYLIQCGAMTDLIDTEGETPLQAAKTRKHDTMVALLTRFEESKKKNKLKDDIESYSRDSFTQHPELADLLKLTPPSNLELLSNEKQLARLLGPAFGIPLIITLLSMFPFWFSLLSTVAVIYGLTRLAQMKKDSIHDLFVVGVWYGSVIVTIIAFVGYLAPDLEGYTFIKFLFVVTLIVMWVFHTKASISDPGFVDTAQQDQESLFKQAELGIIDDSKYCKTCMVYKPLRSKHDRFSNRCIDTFDHYCVWIAQVVAFKNRTPFLLFAYMEIITQIAFFFLALKYLGRDLPSFALGDIRDHIFSPELAFVTITSLYGFICFAFVGSVAVFQTKAHMMDNLTTNENIGGSRYPQIVVFRNQKFCLFSKGWLENIKEFWLAPYPERVYDVSHIKLSPFARQWLEQRNLTHILNANAGYAQGRHTQPTIANGPSGASHDSQCQHGCSHNEDSPPGLLRGLLDPRSQLVGHQWSQRQQQQQAEDGTADLDKKH